jgi:EpsD family peptidyl-prolyl cis-trans isomerase
MNPIPNARRACIPFPGSHARWLVIAALSGLALAGCGDKESAAGAAVMVNGEALSAIELDAKLKQYEHLPPERKAAVSVTVLKSLVDLELLRQAAIADKLDADATIRARIDASNRMILANAFLEKRNAAVATPTAQEIKAYYEQHPDQFAKRKRFELEELMIEARPENAAVIKAKLEDGSDYKAFVAWLGEQKILNDVQPASASSEQMSDDVLGKLRDAKAGDTILIEGEDQLSVIRVNTVDPQPLSLAEAGPMIGQKLFQQRQTEAINQALNELREKAKIEYVAPYSEKGIAPASPQ